MRGETVLIDGEPVENVLVHVGEYGSSQTPTDVTDEIGPVADYTLYFPKNYAGSLTGKTATVRGIDCEVLGVPDHERPDKVFGAWIGNWDMLARVRKVVAGYKEHVAIYATTVTRDALGSRTTTVKKIYEGAAQVRFSQADESNTEGGYKSSKSVYVIVPWDDALAAYQTQEITIDYAGKTYDVASVENVGEAGKRASIRAVLYE